MSSYNLQLVAMKTQHHNTYMYHLLMTMYPYLLVFTS